MDILSIPQILGYMGMLGSCLGCGLKNPRYSILSYFISNIIWIIHYIALGAEAGMWMSALVVVRSGFGLFASERWMKRSVFLFVALTVVLLLPKLTGGAAAVLLVGAILGHLCILYRENGPTYRILNVSCLGCWLVYHIAVVSYGGVVNDLIQIGITLAAIAAFDLHWKQSALLAPFARRYGGRRGRNSQ